MAWMEQWQPEDEQFWRETGRTVAWRTLTITTLCLVLSFATWFTMSAVVVYLPEIGFKFDKMQLFWLAAMPGLASGILRIVNTFLIPIFGTRLVVGTTTLLKLIPCLALGLAIASPDTPFWAFMSIAFLCGLGGGDFSSYMPSTSLFFPKRLQGTALGIQAGIGNFGVSLTQFMTPWIISFAAFGTMAGTAQVVRSAGVEKNLWVQNAAFWYVPLLALLGIVAFACLRAVPVKATFREQLDIFKSKHTWFCTMTYVMTFGSFSGFAAAFPLMIKTIYGGFPNGPKPLTYAFLGPLIGSTTRVIFGYISDKTGGAILTQIAGIVLIGCCMVLIFGGLLTPDSVDQFPWFLAVMLTIFAFAGIGNASTFRQYPVIFSHSPRQGAGVIGWTAAIAAFGPFIFATLIGAAIEAKAPDRFFWGAAAFYLIATAINWWYYTRRGCEKPC